MAGSITNNAALYKKKTFTYVSPTPPAELIDSTNFTIDFAERKFLHVGLDPTKKFDVSILIITPSRFVKIPVDFLRHIFSLMGQILSHILDTTTQYKRFIFLETESMSISNMWYKGETVLVIESKTEAGCRILLNRKDLMAIQYLEWAIFENVSRKIKIIKPMVQDQIEKMVVHFFSLHDEKTTSMDDMISIIASSHGENIQTTENCILSELKLFAAQQIATHWFEMQETKELKNYTEAFNLDIMQPSPPRYSSMSPMYNDFDPSQAADEERGIEEFLTQATSIQKTESLPNDDSDCLPPTIIDTFPAYFHPDNFAQPPPWYTAPETSTAVDENDGPTSFNHSPSILDCAGGKPTKKRNVKRKLFE